MPMIYHETYIEAPIERVFDLARSIEVHIETVSKTNDCPTCDMLLGGSAVSLRDGTSR